MVDSLVDNIDNMVDNINNMAETEIFWYF